MVKAYFNPRPKIWASDSDCLSLGCGGRIKIVWNHKPERSLIVCPVHSHFTWWNQLDSSSNPSMACPSPRTCQNLSSPRPVCSWSVGPTVLSLLGWKMLRRAAACHWGSKKKNEKNNPWLSRVVPGFRWSANGEVPISMLMYCWQCWTFWSSSKRMVLIGCARRSPSWRPIMEDLHWVVEVLVEASPEISQPRILTGCESYYVFSYPKFLLQSIRTNTSSQIGNGVQWCCTSVYTRKHINIHQSHQFVWGLQQLK